jgi:hypothetical protein
MLWNSGRYLSAKLAHAGAPYLAAISIVSERTVDVGLYEELDRSRIAELVEQVPIRSLLANITFPADQLHRDLIRLIWKTLI